MLKGKLKIKENQRNLKLYKFKRQIATLRI